MKNAGTPPGDDFEIRCPRLGNAVAFSYCRIESQGLPCFKIVDCWYEHFMIEDFLRQALKPDEWEKVFNRPRKAKVLTLVELIEEAKRGAKEEM